MMKSTNQFKVPCIDRQRGRKGLNTTMYPTVDYHDQTGPPYYLLSMSIAIGQYFFPGSAFTTSVTQHALETQCDWDLMTRRDTHPLYNTVMSSQMDIFKYHHYLYLRYFPIKDGRFLLDHKHFFLRNAGSSSFHRKLTVPLLLKPDTHSKLCTQSLKISIYVRWKQNS